MEVKNLLRAGQGNHPYMFTNHFPYQCATLLIVKLKEYLNSKFSMKDLGEAAYVLGIKIYRDRSKRLLALSQSTYLEKVLKRFKMDKSKRGFGRTGLANGTGPWGRKRP